MIHGSEGLPVAVYEIAPSHERYRMLIHWHPEHEIVYIKSGRLDLRLNDNTLTALAGDVIFIPGGTIHSGEPEDCVYTCILTDLEKLQRKSDDCMEFVRLLALWEIRVPTRLSEYSECFGRLCEEISMLRSEKRAGYPFAVKSRIFAFFAEMLDRELCYREICEKSAVSRKQEKIKSAISFMERNCGERITLEMLAKTADMSVNHFLRSFKEVTGTSPLKYLNEYRLAKARHDLKESDVSVTAVALACGYSDVSYFIACFKKAFGVTPGHHMKIT